MTERRGPKPHKTVQILSRAMNMKLNGERINKSRIAREVHCSIRQVMRVLPRVSR